MKRTTTNTARAYPLLFDTCRCGTGGRLRCLTCRRWSKHYSMLMRRRAEWRAAR